MKKFKDFKMFKKSFTIDDRTYYNHYPTHNDIIDAINLNLKGAKIVDVREHVIFKYEGRKWQAVVKSFRGAYYIDAISCGGKDEQ